jgi:hypothetical protein
MPEPDLVVVDERVVQQAVGRVEFGLDRLLEDADRWAKTASLLTFPVITAAYGSLHLQ